VLFAQQNTIKTAFGFSRIDFYFVTCFYSFVRYLHGAKVTFLSEKRHYFVLLHEHFRCLIAMLHDVDALLQCVHTATL